ncbi:MAG: mobile mystery protein A [Actinobacteria bacterium]|nr:mobile mystery protein A [Actinomycetota bacterium]
MKRTEQARRARRMLDARLRRLPAASEFASPRAGWIRALRDALGMSAAELGRRMGVSGATVSEIEANEREGGVRLATLRRAAEAMDCTLVYALVPRESLEQTVRSRAEQILLEQEWYVHQTMRLEDQEPDESSTSRERHLEEIANSRHLWTKRWSE